MLVATSSKTTRMLLSKILLSFTTCAVFGTCAAQGTSTVHKKIQVAQLHVIKRIAKLQSSLWDFTASPTEHVNEAVLEYWSEVYNGTMVHMEELVRYNFCVNHQSDEPLVEIVVKGGMQLYVEALKGNFVESNAILDFVANHLSSAHYCKFPRYRLNCVRRLESTLHDTISKYNIKPKFDIPWTPPH